MTFARSISTFTLALAGSLACGSGGSDDSAFGPGGSTSGDTQSQDDDDDDGDDGPTVGPGDGTAGDTGVGPDDTGDPDGTGGPGPIPGCGEVVTFADDIAPLQEIHVSTRGADGAGCGAERAPCQTLAFAADQAQPGTSIVMHPGEYEAAGQLNLRGTAEAPIWLGGAEGRARPVIRGGDVAFQLSQPAYLVVHDLEVADAVANGINTDDGDDRENEEAAHHLVVRNVYIHDIGTGGNNDCLKLSGVNDFVVVDSEFVGCGGGQAGSGIDMVGCHRGLIAFSSFHDSPEGGNAIQTKGGSFDLDIHANRFENAGARALNLGGSTGIEYFRPPLVVGEPAAEAHDIRATSNVIFASEAAIAFVGCVDCAAVHNTIVDSTHWVFRILQESEPTAEYPFEPASNGRVANNIVWFQRGVVSTVLNVGAGTEPETFTFEHDLWYASDAPEQSDPDGELPAPDAGAVIGQDPGFSDLAAGDVSIAAGSPAAGAAGPSPVAVAGDHTGACFDRPASIGAFEVPR